MIKTKAAFLEGRLLSNQSDQSEKFSKSPDWAGKKAALQKSQFCFDHFSKFMVCSHGQEGEERGGFEPVQTFYG